MNFQIPNVKKVLVIAGVGLLPACGAMPDEPIGVEQGALLAFNRGDFATSVQNPFLPLVPGTIYRTRVTLLPGQDESITEVTHQTRRILGIDTIVVHDRAFFEGKIIEDTFDYLKPDRFGNVRYFGEDTTEFDEEGNVISTAGSFRAGSNGAAGPQIFLQGTARVGDVYFEEFAPNDDALDQAEVTSVNKSIHVPISPDAALHGCRETHNFTTLEPDQKERKVYCRGFGFVRSDSIKGDPKREELVSITRP